MLDVKKIVDSFDTLQPIPMAPHPRLFIDAEAIKRLHLPSETSMLREAQAVVDEIAEASLKSVEIDYDITSHNSNLVRGRFMQKNVFSLLVRYFQTGEKKYRDRVIDCIREMDGWTYWSWFDWRAQAEPDREAEFVSYDLSYGENSMTLAVAYDLLYDTLSKEEKQLFLDTIKHHRVITEFIRHAILGQGCARGNGTWIQNEKCNWLAVTCGGMGMLALAFYEELEEARQALALCDPAIMTLMEYVDHCGGSWPEGLGYFSYTLRYAVPYLESWEKSTGKKHPAYDLEGSKHMVEFFLDLQPGGIACTFGDSNTAWLPYGFHYILCRRYGQEYLFEAIDNQTKSAEAGAGWSSRAIKGWPIQAEWLLFGNRDADIPKSGCDENVVKLYPGTNFAVMADTLPYSDFCMTIRGGNTKGPHEHNDLSSFHLVYGDEAFIKSLSCDEYIDSTFSPRRHELFEMMAPAKNVLLVNGVGMSMFNEVQQSVIDCCGYKGIRMDCTDAMGNSGFSFKAVSSYVRTFLMLSKNAFLILDDVVSPNAARFDLRFHTFANLEERETEVIMSSKKHADKKMKLTFTASEDSILLTGLDTPTKPNDDPSKVIRWASEHLHKEYVAATLLTKDLSAEVSLKKTDGVMVVEATVDGVMHRVTV